MANYVYMYVHARHLVGGEKGTSYYLEDLDEWTYVDNCSLSHFPEAWSDSCSMGKYKTMVSEWALCVA